jgi:hypothetical protein
MGLFGLLQPLSDGFKLMIKEPFDSFTTNNDSNLKHKTLQSKRLHKTNQNLQRKKHKF